MDHIVNMRNPLPPSLRPLEKASVWALCAAVFCIMLAFAPVAGIPFAATKGALVIGFAILAFALYVIARLGRGNIILPPSALLGALWLPALAYALSTLAHGITPVAVWGTQFETDSLAFVVAATVLGTVAALALRNAVHYRALVRALVVTAVALLALEAGGVALKFFMPALNFVNPSVVGTVTDLGIALGLIVMGSLFTLRSFALGRRAEIALKVQIAVALLLLFIFNSQLVLVCVALVAFGFFIERNVRRSPESSEDFDLEDTTVLKESHPEEDGHVLGSLVPFLIFFFSVSFLIFSGWSAHLAAVFHFNTLSVRPSWQATYTIMSKAYGSEPIFGTGPMTFANDWSKFHSASLNATPFWNTDFASGIGYLPTSFVTTGLLGALAWLAFLALYLIAGLRTVILRPPQDPFLRFVLTGAFFGSAYLFLMMLLDVPGPAILALAFVLAGLFISVQRFTDAGGQWGIVFAKAPRLSLGVVVILTLLLLGSVSTLVPFYSVYAADLAVAQIPSVGSADYPATQAAVRRAIARGSLHGETAYVAALFDTAHLNEILANPASDQAAAREDFQATLTDGVQAALKATQSSPDSYRYWIALGSLYGTVVPFKVNGAYDGAKAAYEKAQALNPSDPEIPYLLAQLDIANGNSKAAEEDLKAAIALKQDYTNAIILLSRLQISDGNIKDALAASEAAAYFTPTDPNVLFQLGILRAATGDLRGAALALEGAVAASPSSANARYFLAIIETKLKDYPDALTQIKAIATLSTANASAVAGVQTALAEGRDPFPANILSASSTPVQ